MDISHQQLKSAIEKAYEEGWRGYLELKGEYASRVADEFSKSAGANLPSVFFTTTSGVYQNTIDPHYFYSTIPSPESTRHDEVV